MPTATVCRCTLCDFGFSDRDIDSSIWGLRRKPGGRGFMEICPCADSQVRVCVYCVGQIQATNFGHSFLERGKGVPLAEFV